MEALTLDEMSADLLTELQHCQAVTSAHAAMIHCC